MGRIRRLLLGERAQISIETIAVLVVLLIIAGLIGSSMRGLATKTAGTVNDTMGSLIANMSK